jgi:hypothetical protein
MPVYPDGWPERFESIVTIRLTLAQRMSERGHPAVLRP